MQQYMLLSDILQHSLYIGWINHMGGTDILKILATKALQRIEYTQYIIDVN